MCAPANSISKILGMVVLGNLRFKKCLHQVATGRLHLYFKGNGMPKMVTVGWLCVWAQGVAHSKWVLYNGDTGRHPGKSGLGLKHKTYLSLFTSLSRHHFSINLKYFQNYPH